MAELNHIDVAECEALHRVGTVLSVNTAMRTLDVRVDGTVYEDIEVHYHCQDWWVNESHPHPDDKQEQMMSVFSVDDQVLVSCNDSAVPLYVVGFPSNPKSCSGIIVLMKEGDIWYWDLVNNQGYHVDPGIADPLEPEIIRKWYTCVDLEVAEFYTRLTPVLSSIATGACTESCGIGNFEQASCCDEPEAGDDESDLWGVCPCDGEWDSGLNRCRETIECVGIGDFSEIRSLVGCESTRNRIDVVDRNCVEGTSYGLSLGNLDESIEVGPRELQSGNESKSICTEESSVCGPYVRNKRCCSGWNPVTEQCIGKFDPYACGTECNESQTCTGWTAGPPGAVWRWTIYTHTGAVIDSGCMTYEREVKTASYSTEYVPLVTSVEVNGEVLEFEGWWNQYKSDEGSLDYTRGITGFDNDCQGCDQGDLETDTYDDISYTYSEFSYGVGGWWTVVSSDDRFAVLIPELNLSASVQSNDGDVTGSISSTTTMILRIVDNGETEFDIADADKNYTLTSMPTGRDDLLIKPNCNARELPLTVTLRAFHWYELYDWILVAFMLDGEFEANLIKNENDVWNSDQLTAFKAWVGSNSLEDYTMFLH